MLTPLVLLQACMVMRSSRMPALPANVAPPAGQRLLLEQMQSATASSAVSVPLPSLLTMLPVLSRAELPMQIVC